MSRAPRLTGRSGCDDCSLRLDFATIGTRKIRHSISDSRGDVDRREMRGLRRTGRLTFLGERDRLELIRNLPVYDVEAKMLVPLGEVQEQLLRREGKA